MAIENLQVKSISLTKDFFRDNSPLIKVSADTRMQLMYLLTRASVLPVIKSVEIKILTSSGTYSELKSLKLFQCTDDGVTVGLSTVVATKQTLESLGIRLHYEKLSSSDSAVYKPSHVEQEMYGTAVWILNCYNDTREYFYRRKGETFVHARLVYGGAIQRDCVKAAIYCRDHKIDDEELFVFTMFKHFGWNYCPPLKTLYGQEAITIYDNEKDSARRDLLDWKASVQRDVELKRAKDTGTRKSPYRDMFVGIEKTKSILVYQGKEADCMAQLNSLFGYHPKSPTCGKCPLAVACREATQNTIRQHTNGMLDVMALREGTVDLVEIAEKMLAAGVNIDLFGDGGVDS